MKAAFLFGALAMAAPATPQLLPGVVNQLPSGVLDPVLSGGQPGGAIVPPISSVSPLDIRPLGAELAPSSLLSLRRARLRDLVRNNRELLDMDAEGAPIRKDEVIGLDMTPAGLAAAERLGFRQIRRDSIEGVGIAVTVLATPKGMRARKAIEALRQADPSGSYELNHVYEPAGGAPAAPQQPARPGQAGGVVIGLIDGGVGAHPALAGARIEQRGFTPAGVKATGHGTAVASLLVGEAGRFRGVAPGAALLAADVYGGQPAGGSAEAIARAMGWLAMRKVAVVNISLVGPPNRLIEASVKALARRGTILVAPVGNDGPAAPPQYPASYPGVVAVTGVDARDRQLIEAGRATHVDFAAPGADMAGAVPGGGYEALRGTSFAAPLVAARLALAPMASVAASAVPGKGKALGRGIVCRECRVPPAAMGVR
ncbi:serine protease [Sphingomonas oleivorans]|uniref:Serine protease n=1 Tax=Sphingomonas oleivorans TaxID=1735121 RepID=A0A2T5G086_9SPHN|nr:S8 family serine peptidase [Sphingomonas oleivorans]PTQ12358.1 serine protease [Sphingomonas oleivorans]